MAADRPATEDSPRVFDPAKISYDELLRIFWEAHDPTQGMRQGNDQGTQYRSAIFYHRQAQQAAEARLAGRLPEAAGRAGFGEITTEVASPAGEFYFAEDYHQQYLSDSKNPNGYCPAHGTGVSCPVGVVRADG